VLSQSACSILSYSPTVELIKAAGIATNNAMSVAPSEARDVIQHPGLKPNEPIQNVCIEFNRASPAADVVPALQQELLALGISSRVHEVAFSGDRCHYWLHYTAFIEWEVPAFGERVESYVSQATLTLREDGQVRASAAYGTEGAGLSRWASTRKKLAPLVKAVVSAPPAGQAKIN
jgi:hypothetical protein